SASKSPAFGSHSAVALAIAAGSASTIRPMATRPTSGPRWAWMAEMRSNASHRERLRWEILYRNCISTFLPRRGAAETIPILLSSPLPCQWSLGNVLEQGLDLRRPRTEVIGVVLVNAQEKGTSGGLKDTEAGRYL